MLYASDFEGDRKVLSFENTVISCSDDFKLKKKAAALYENASTVDELFAAWSEPTRKRPTPKARSWARTP